MNVLGFLKATFLQNNRSPEWPNIRKQHLEKQPECQACGTKNKLEVHHIEPFHVNPSRELDPNNLITLCGRNCHLVFGHLMDYSSWNDNVIEDCKVYLTKVNERPYKIHIKSSKKSFIYNIIQNFYRRIL